MLVAVYGGSGGHESDVLVWWWEMVEVMVMRVVMIRSIAGVRW